MEKFGVMSFYGCENEKLQKEYERMFCNMTQEEKQLLYKPKRWALYRNNEFISSYPSHNSAKAALHRRCELMKKYPYDYEGEYYTIKPYNHD